VPNTQGECCPVGNSGLERNSVCFVSMAFVVSRGNHLRAGRNQGEKV